MQKRIDILVAIFYECCIGMLVSRNVIGLYAQSAYKLCTMQYSILENLKLYVSNFVALLQCTRKRYFMLCMILFWLISILHDVILV